MKKKRMAKGIWRAAWPLLLYWLLSTVSVAFIAIPLGFGLMESTLLGNLICAPVYWLLYRRDRNRIQIYEGGHLPLELYPLIWAVSGTAALAIMSNRIIYMLNLSSLSERFRDISQALSYGNPWIGLLTGIIAAPIVEELLMRGVLYGRLRSIMSARAAILCSALLFGIMHGNLVQGIHAFVIGIFLAWLMERFGNILVPILGHMAANIVPSMLVWEMEGGYLMEIVICAACVGRTVQILRERREDAD
jgi:membrane protease YdiL (CAAX protease family)